MCSCWPWKGAENDVTSNLTLSLKDRSTFFPSLYSDNTHMPICTWQQSVAAEIGPPRHTGCEEILSYGQFMVQLSTHLANVARQGCKSRTTFSIYALAKVSVVSMVTIFDADHRILTRKFVKTISMATLTLSYYMTEIWQCPQHKKFSKQVHNMKLKCQAHIFLLKLRHLCWATLIKCVKGRTINWP